MVGADLHAHVAAAHAQHGGVEFAAGAVLATVEEGDGVAGLQAQHLHVAGGARGQVDLGTRRKVDGAVEAGHVRYLFNGISVAFSAARNA